MSSNWVDWVLREYRKIQLVSFGSTNDVYTVNRPKTKARHLSGSLLPFENETVQILIQQAAVNLLEHNEFDTKEN